jgi:putative DNA methylase
MTAGDRRKLIEVALPLDAINAEAAREKSIRHGHPSTLHLWWARRPLAACRAVLFAQLVDDPSAHPEQFPTEEDQEAERARLFRIIEDLVKWENVTNETVLEAARAEILRSCDGNPPPIVDPFAGGGSIPLEAQRLGLEAHASDLNPVAVLINKALIEIPPRWSGRPPVHPDDGRTLGNQSWSGAQGLAEDVRFYGQWMRDRAQERIGHLYPTATLEDGSQATVISWIWARTVTCPNPACGATMPLVRSFWLGKKQGKEAWVRPVVDGKQVRFEIGHDPSGPKVEGTVGRQGALCIGCDSHVPLNHVRAEGRAGRMGTQLMAIVAEGERRRIYLAPDRDHEHASLIPRPAEIPNADLPSNPRDFKTPNYGMTSFADLFTNRQLTALCTFSDLVMEARDLIVADAAAAGRSTDEAAQYADDVATYLGFAVSRMTDYSCALAGWVNAPNMEIIGHLFTRQAIPMVWDYAEANVLEPFTGSLQIMVKAIANVVERLPVHGSRESSASQLNASTRVFADLVISTDPPYYDNIGYADLADFFYVWLRRSLRSIHPELLSTMLTPKAEELIATPSRFDGSKERAKQFFEDGFVETFTCAAEQQLPGYPMTIFYAFKQSEKSEADGTASTGWETMLQGLMSAGLAITGTWPMRTEKAGRMLSMGTNALASSIVLVCRPRSVTAGVTDRAGFLAALRSELPSQLHVLQQAAIAPVDLAQASIGPGMAVFSRYAKVVEPSGDSMRVRTALGLINQVLDEVLNEQDAELDPDTRWAVKWFETRGMDEGPYGEAELLSTATGVSVDGLVRSGIVVSAGNKARLVERDELPEDWDPANDDRISVWEATQHLVRTLESGGESAAADLLARLGGIGDSAQLLAYRLYAICERKGWAKEAGPYNALAAVWGSLQTMAAAGPDGEISEEQGSLLE